MCIIPSSSPSTVAQCDSSPFSLNSFSCSLSWSSFYINFPRAWSCLLFIFWNNAKSCWVNLPKALLLTARLRSVPGNSAPSVHFRAQPEYIGRHSSVNKNSRCDLRFMRLPSRKYSQKQFSFLCSCLFHATSCFPSSSPPVYNQIEKQSRWKTRPFIHYASFSQNADSLYGRILANFRIEELVFSKMFADNLQTSRIRLKHNFQTISIHFQSAKRAYAVHSCVSNVSESVWSAGMGSVGSNVTGTTTTDPTTFLPDATPTLSEREQLKIEFYKTYDVMTGVRIAATLGGFFSLMVILVVYKSRWLLIPTFRKRDASRK